MVRTAGKLSTDTERQLETNTGVFRGMPRDWAYSHPQLIVTTVARHNEEEYPTIKGEEIEDVVVTDYKIDICLKDKSKPTLTFLLYENFVECVSGECTHTTTNDDSSCSSSKET